MKHICKILLFITALLLSGQASYAAVINEVCAANDSVYITESGSTPDWIELYNDGDKDINLAGWYLSNDEDYLQLADLSEYIIPAGGYLVLCADKNELSFSLSSSGCDIFLTSPEGETQSVHLPELPRDSSYSLQADGSWLVTEGRFRTEYSEISVVSFGDNIMFGAGNDGIGPVDLLAEQLGFQHTKWATSGATIAWKDIDSSATESEKRYNIQYQVEASIAAGDNPNVIIINGRTNDLNWIQDEEGNYSVESPLGVLSENESTEEYDRTTFIGGLETVFSMLKAAWPDAEIVYVIDFDIKDTVEEYIDIYSDACLSAAKKWGVKVVDLYHNSEFSTRDDKYLVYTNPTESEPEGDGTHPNEDGYRLFYLPLMEEVLLPIFDSMKSATVMETTSPGRENNLGYEYVQPVYVKAPSVSIEAGYYDEAVDVELTAAEGSKIYYTLDETVPTENSELYTGPVHLEDASANENVYSKLKYMSIHDMDISTVKVPKCNILKAIAVDKDGNVSECITKSYFIGFNDKSGVTGIMTVSIVGDPEEIFGDENGIYRTGTEFMAYSSDALETTDALPDGMHINYLDDGIESEREVNAEFFSEDGELLLTQNLGLRIHGGYSRHNLQKSLSLKARSKYGEDSIDYRFFEGLPKVSSLVVRNEDFVPYDVINHRLTAESSLLTAADIPCLVYLNGEYWGMYYLRETQNEDYIAYHYGTTKDKILMCKNGEGQGATEFKQMKNTLCSLDMSLDENYAIAKENIDLVNYAQFIANQMISENVDGFYWNVTTWKSTEKINDQELDGRWRWICQDMDITLAKTSIAEKYTTIWARLETEELFLNLLKNADFRQIFLKELAEMANINYSEGRATEVINSLYEINSQYISLWLKRYSEGIYGTYKDRFTDLIYVIRAQRESLFTDMASILGIGEKFYDIDVKADSTLPIDFNVNGRDVPLTDGTYESKWYEGQTVSFSVEDMEGYRFDGWYIENELVTDNNTVDVDVSADAEYVPKFTEYSKIFSVDDKKSCIIKNGTVIPVMSSWNLDAQITSDYAMSLTQNGEVEISSSDKWKKSTGFELIFDTSGYCDISLAYTCIPDKDSPSKWLVECSSDGNEWVEVDEIKCESEKRIILHLPDSADDCCDFHVRITAAKKGGSSTLVLKNIYLYGTESETNEGGEFAEISRERDEEAETEKQTEAAETESVQFDASVDASLDGFDLSATQYGTISLSWYYILTVDGEGNTGTARFSLPDGVTVPKLYIYRMSDSQLEEVAILTPDENRSYIFENAEPGTYLLLQDSAENCTGYETRSE